MRVGESGGAVKVATSEKKVEPAKQNVNVAETNSTSVRTKSYEQNFAANYTAAKLSFWGRTEPTPAPTPQQQTQPLTTNGGGTDTTYRIGNPTRPNIRHDNGFLQNPNDKNDPNPIPTIPPTMSDRLYRASQLTQVYGAQAIDGVPIPFTDKDNTARRLDDGIEAYRHFLEGNGADRNFSYDKFVNEDSAGRTVLNNAIADTQRGAENLYNQMIARDPSLANKPITFNITSGAVTVGGSDSYPYPETEDWQKAIGGHSIWNSATVTVTPPTTPGGKPQFSMQYTLHGEDRYNFNPGQADIATGVPDSERGRLEATGLAHQYTQYGTLNRDVTWTQGNISTTTNTTNPNQGR